MPILTIKEIAAHYGTTEKAVYGWNANGCPIIKTIPRTYNLDDVEKWKNRPKWSNFEDRKCEGCGLAYKSRTSTTHRRFCSKLCLSKSRSPNYKTFEIKNCKQCGVEFQWKKTNRGENIFCTHRCSWTWHNRNRTLEANVFYACCVCRNQVRKYVSLSAQKEGFLRFCTRTCAGVWRSGENHPLWEGGKVLRNGYVYIYNPTHPHAKELASPYISEHRLVMENHLGRYLTGVEVVHHKDRNPQNNSIENLELFASHAEHMRLHKDDWRDEKTGRYEHFDNRTSGRGELHTN